LVEISGIEPLTS